MDIYVNGKDFRFDDASKIETGFHGYDLKVIEPGFDESTKTTEARFTSKPLMLPSHIEVQIKRCPNLEPCGTVFKDANGKRMLETNFD